ncbi:hypothetical protein B484DRAFT_415494 [Ochromonadaceae sp. CCMP2298]|nr:hypothetical protein B484DRAFT_415494 [Ochromonadaceae sp. CCMP2298]
MSGQQRAAESAERWAEFAEPWAVRKGCKMAATLAHRLASRSAGCSAERWAVWMAGRWAVQKGCKMAATLAHRLASRSADPTAVHWAMVVGKCSFFNTGD